MSFYHECQRELWKLEDQHGPPEWGARIYCTCGQMYELRKLKFWAIFAPIHSYYRFAGDYYWGKVKA